MSNPLEGDILPIADEARITEVLQNAIALEASFRTDAEAYIASLPTSSEGAQAQLLAIATGFRTVREQLLERLGEPIAEIVIDPQEFAYGMAAGVGALCADRFVGMEVLEGSTINNQPGEPKTSTAYLMSASADMVPRRGKHRPSPLVTVERRVDDERNIMNLAISTSLDSSAGQRRYTVSVPCGGLAVATFEGPAGKQTGEKGAVLESGLQVLATRLTEAVVAFDPQDDFEAQRIAAGDVTRRTLFYV